MAPADTPGCEGWEMFCETDNGDSVIIAAVLLSLSSLAVSLSLRGALTLVALVVVAKLDLSSGL